MEACPSEDKVVQIQYRLWKFISNLSMWPVETYIPVCIINPFLAEFRGIKSYKNTWRNEISYSLTHTLTWTSICLIIWMQHFYRPTIHCNVLTCNGKDQKREQSWNKMYVFFSKKIFNVISKIKENDTHCELSWDYPGFALAKRFKIVYLYKRWPKHFQAEWYRAHAQYTKFTIGKILLKQEWYCGHEEPECQSLKRIEDD